nr:MAG TPA: hypothetical protein [Caudoviricetes sp.]
MLHVIASSCCLDRCYYKQKCLNSKSFFKHFC